MSEGSAAFFAMTDANHFGRLRPLISGVAAQGIAPYVFTHRRFKADVERHGGTFVDLFERYPIEAADAESIPISCRFVSFAGHYADEILRDLEALGPSLVVCGPFSVIGRVVATSLRIPHVNVCWGHNLPPERAVPLLSSEWPRIHVSPRCLHAVEMLRERYGMHDATPFSFMSGQSRFLNVYCEPSEYLTEEERRAFEPIAFYGSLPSIEELQARDHDSRPPCFGDEQQHLKVYVSFGTIVWRHFADKALDALESVSTSLGRMQDVRALISLGGVDITPGALRALIKPNVSVASSVHQWRVLQEADVFVTHQGLNSTHEAIFHGVPMISYPFFADQPALAEKCRSLGVAIPLTDRLRGEVTPRDVDAAFAELEGRRESLEASLAEAREWELRTIADRAAVHRRIAGLIGG